MEEVWAMDGSDAEAASFADISTASLSEFLTKHPDIAERKAKLKERPVLKARTTVVNNLHDPDLALRYLEKKAKREFGNRLELSNDPDNPLAPAAVVVTVVDARADAKAKKRSK